MNTVLPPFVPLLMVLSLVLCVFCFYKASGNSTKVLSVIIGFAIVQGLVAFLGFYTNFHTVPPRLPLLVLPSFALIALLFAFPMSRFFLDNIDPSWLTFLHIVRFPIELVLYWLFLFDLVPELMTFEGRNFDILSGISAPFIAYWAYIKKSMSPKWMLVWNFICLALLLNIVIQAILSAPGPFQQLSFDVPNTGVFYFPYVWLPSIIVPLVFLSHVICIRQIIRTISLKQGA